MILHHKALAGLEIGLELHQREMFPMLCLVEQRPALVRTKRPTWSPELVKADIMNTAEQDLFTGTSHSGNRYGPEREGAGKAAPERTARQERKARRGQRAQRDQPGSTGAELGTAPQLMQ